MEPDCCVPRDLQRCRRIARHPGIFVGSGVPNSFQMIKEFSDLTRQDRAYLEGTKYIVKRRASGRQQPVRCGNGLGKKLAQLTQFD